MQCSVMHKNYCLKKINKMNHWIKSIKQEGLNPLSPKSANWHSKTCCFLKKLQLSQSHEHCLNYQLWAWTRKFFQLRIPNKHKKVSDFCKILAFEFWQQQKWPFSTSWKKQQKSCFCLQIFLLKSLLQTQKSTFTAKFSPSPSIEVIFSALIPCLWPSYSLSF